ncbi:MAG: DUF3301 domain-containing protein [Gammaproteobacteria bacterium]
MQELLLIAVLLVVVLYWWDTAYTNELALNKCRHLCRNAQLQLLDETVMRQRIWLARSAAGTLQLCRIYSFDYSDDDDARWQGYIVTLGRHVAETSMDPRHVTGRTIEVPGNEEA